jgi:tRNA A37 threonylcarbamoyladenosine biosynthesis protein TsaE
VGLRGAHVGDYQDQPSRLHHLDSIRPSWKKLEWIRNWRSSGVVAVEWAERLSRTVRGAVEINLVDTGGDTRAITVVFNA